MKRALLGTAAAVALVLGCGLTASAAAQQAAGPASGPVQQPADAPQDARATPDGRDRQSVQREQVTLRDGATVTVLRPAMAPGEQASGQAEDVVVAERARPPSWQVAGGGRLWAIDPATNELRTCAVHHTSTVGLKVLRCLATSWQ